MRAALRTSWNGIKPPPYGLLSKAHPLAQGLLGFWNLAEASSVPVMNAVNGRLSTRNGTVTAQASPYGIVQAFAGGASSWQNLDGGLTDMRPALPATLFALVQLANWTNNYTVFGIGCQGTATNYAGLEIESDTSGRFYVGYGDNTGSSTAGRRTIITATSAAVIGQWIAVGGSIRGATDMSLYINGVDVAGTLFGSAAGAGPVYLGDSFIGFASDHPDFAGAVAVCALWNRSLAPDEHALLAANPFALFAQPPIFPSGAPPAPGTIAAPFIAGASAAYMPALSSPTPIGTLVRQGGAISVG